MNDHTSSMKRIQVLKLGSASAFAALVALADLSSAEAKSGLDIPLGLDITNPDGGKSKGRKAKAKATAPTQQAATMATITRDAGVLNSTATIVYIISGPANAGPTVKGKFDKCEFKTKANIGSTVYIALWY